MIVGLRLWAVYDLDSHEVVSSSSDFHLSRRCMNVLHDCSPARRLVLLRFDLCPLYETMDEKNVPGFSLRPFSREQKFRSEKC